MDNQIVEQFKVQVLGELAISRFRELGGTDKQMLAVFHWWMSGLDSAKRVASHAAAGFSDPEANAQRFFSEPSRPVRYLLDVLKVAKFSSIDFLGHSVQALLKAEKTAEAAAAGVLSQDGKMRILPPDLHEVWLDVARGWLDLTRVAAPVLEKHQAEKGPQEQLRQKLRADQRPSDDQLLEWMRSMKHELGTGKWADLLARLSTTETPH